MEAGQRRPRDRLYASSDTGDTLMGDIDRCYCGTKFHVGFDQLVTIVMNGKTYKAKMHKTVKGRLDRLTDLYREQGLAESDTIEARYSATENTIYLEKI